ncbi:cytochrome ubiquinol oxidase subunit I [Saccharopolyspora karakumensis]|uniref:Cytochrome ubiquinol oxidase subunit I n=1 Tax=Saccharopolyspora karakumensis TaxID=2530386 RepID=A0A4R5BJJ6_9PSEU|nr:cytochrome ubiquinol oxidase subunit I [Saccharopolyspora karakumensis]TDD85799.1 cytochrome ubiquinol oxidase subunit I [Saccharopolyspora karakumensis]
MYTALAEDTLARWQFGLTTVYHYIFVPLTIGLAAITAGLETAWVRTDREKYFHATKFWGKLFLINIALGVVTGIVQEFQFGMNWSAYSRFVGDVFGAPLAMEALLAFFFESTFIGLWIFGWDRLPRKIHCACLWIVSLGTVLSSYFILAANSWMQHPVGYRIDPATGKAQLTDIGAVLFQKTTVVVVAHTLTAAMLTAGAFVVGISALHLWRDSRRKNRGAPVDTNAVAAMRSSLRLGLVLAAIAGLGTALSGDSLAKVMFEQQPMKMASAEALWETERSAPFSVFAYGDVAEGRNEIDVQIPGVLSFLAHGDFSTPVPGINDIAAAEAAAFGGQPADYLPQVAIAYWGFRVMIGTGMVSFLVGVAGLWLTRNRLWLSPQFRTRHDAVPRLMVTRNRELSTTASAWAWRIALFTLALPLIANASGWIFTEMGRQPWVVYGLMRTADAVSPAVSTTEQLITLLGFAGLYLTLAIVEVRLLARYASAGPPTSERPPRASTVPSRPSEHAEKPLSFAY